MAAGEGYAEYSVPRQTRGLAVESKATGRRDLRITRPEDEATRPSDADWRFCPNSERTPPTRRRRFRQEGTARRAICSGPVLELSARRSYVRGKAREREIKCMGKMDWERSPSAHHPVVWTGVHLSSTCQKRRAENPRAFRMFPALPRLFCQLPLASASERSVGGNSDTLTGEQRAGDGLPCGARPALRVTFLRMPVRLRVSSDGVGERGGRFWHGLAVKTLKT